MNLLKSIFLISFFLPPFLNAYEYDNELSKKLNREYRKLITKTESGKKFYKRFFNYRKKIPKTLLRYSKDNWLASYDTFNDVIYLNTKYIMIFFEIKDYDDKKIIEVLNFSSETRKEFIYYTDALYLHELVHSLQDSIYIGARHMKEGGFFLEFEYEAYLISDLYFYEKLKNDKKFLLKLILNKYIDFYTANSAGGLFEMSSNIDDYKELIKDRYIKESAGYVSLTEEEKKIKDNLDEKKFLSYAGGDRKEVDIEVVNFERIKKQRQEYEKFINKFYLDLWPSFSYNVLKLIFDVSFEVKNYYLAFKSISSLERNISYYKKTEDDLKDIREKTAILILDFIPWCVENCRKIGWEEAALSICFFEKTIEATKRVFPNELIEIRDDIYSIALKKYLALYDSEKDGYKKSEYKKYIDYFSIRISDSIENNLIK
ncbi:MAG: hypothetical protein K6357_00490 [Elusimicrobiota bacterium]